MTLMTRPQPRSGPPAAVQYAWPIAEAYKSAQLVEVAQRNGYRLTPALLRKWTQWRLIPGPAAGGSTGQGRGKGETWSRSAARRVAWIAYWKAAGLTYDVLRVALWPSTPTLDDRLGDVARSLKAFAVADQDRHDLGTLDDVDDEDLDLYMAWSDGRATDEQIRELVSRAGARGPQELDHHTSFLRAATPDEILETARLASTLDLTKFIGRFRIAAGQYQEYVNEAFLAYPLGLVRIIVRELHRWRVSETAIK